MSHCWDKGVLTTSSWHGLEQIGVMPDADAMIAHGHRSNAWAVRLDTQGIRTTGGVVLDCESHRAIVGHYESRDPRVLGVVGDRYSATTPAQWQDLIRAACAAGAKPTGAFSLNGGSRVIATFDVGGDDNIRDQMVLADSFDGTMSLLCGRTSVRVVCANTMAAAMNRDGKGFARIRHTASLGERVEALQSAIAETVQTGQQTRELYAQARATTLHRDDALAVFDALFPEAPEDAAPATITKAKRARESAKVVATLPINREGNKGNLATLWNAATYLVDRKADGKPRGKDQLGSMLFGARAARVAEIQETIELVLRDGSTVPAHQAAAQGVKVGAAILEQMLAD